MNSKSHKDTIRLGATFDVSDDNYKIINDYAKARYFGKTAMVIMEAVEWWLEEHRDELEEIKAASK